MYSAVYDLLQGVVDYAGLFPPAKLTLPKVVNNYAEYRQSEEAWMLGRLIVPLAEIHALANLASKSEHAIPGSTWRLSCLLKSAESQQLRRDVHSLLDFNDEHRARSTTACVIDAVEVRASTPAEIDAIADALPAQIETFVELPSAHDDTESLIAHLAQRDTRHIRAKIRTGGVLCEMIPSAETLVAFITCCAQHKLPFKATAGLHHPLRAERALTYEQHAERCAMHGFLNVLLATALLYDARQNDVALALLTDTNPDNVVASDGGWRWRKQNITREQIQHMRCSGMISFGSCSFIEPVEELRALDIELTPDDAART